MPTGGLCRLRTHVGQGPGTADRPRHRNGQGFYRESTTRPPPCGVSQKKCREKDGQLASIQRSACPSFLFLKCGEKPVLSNLAGKLVDLIHPLFHGGSISAWHALAADFVGEMANGVQARLQ